MSSTATSYEEKRFGHELLAKIFQQFRDSDFENLQTKENRSQDLSFLDLAAAPGGFTDFLANYRRETTGQKIAKGHAITLGVEAGGKKLQLPRPARYS